MPRFLVWMGPPNSTPDDWHAEPTEADDDLIAMQVAHKAALSRADLSDERARLALTPCVWLHGVRTVTSDPISREDLWESYRWFLEQTKGEEQ
jgi:hypothetical protein